jgi:hypothetical protein
MISDVLSEASYKVRSYLDDPVFAGAYSGDRDQIERVLAEMEALHVILDAPPRTDAREP